MESEGLADESGLELCVSSRFRRGGCLGVFLSDFSFRVDEQGFRLRIVG